MGTFKSNIAFCPCKPICPAPNGSKRIFLYSYQKPYTNIIFYIHQRMFQNKIPWFQLDLFRHFKSVLPCQPKVFRCAYRGALCALHPMRDGLFSSAFAQHVLDGEAHKKQKNDTDAIVTRPLRPESCFEGGLYGQRKHPHHKLQSQKRGLLVSVSSEAWKKEPVPKRTPPFPATGLSVELSEMNPPTRLYPSHTSKTRSSLFQQHRVLRFY